MFNEIGPEPVDDLEVTGEVSVGVKVVLVRLLFVSIAVKQFTQPLYNGEGKDGEEQPSFSVYGNIIGISLECSGKYFSLTSFIHSLPIGHFPSNPRLVNVSIRTSEPSNARWVRVVSISTWCMCGSVGTIPSSCRYHSDAWSLSWGWRNQGAFNGK